MSLKNEIAGLPLRIPHPAPIMNHQQYRRALKLVRECCFNDRGECLLLDEGEGCACVQGHSYTLLCNWFRAAILPLDKQLETELLGREVMQRCAECNEWFSPGSNRAKYCPDCSQAVRRKKEAARQRINYRLSTHLDHFEAL